VPQTDAPKLDDPKPDASKPDEAQGAKRADAELTHAYERIKTAQEDLARLDRLVLGMELSGDGSPIRQKGTGAEPGGAPVSEAPPSPTISENKAPPPDVRRGRPMLLALVGFLLAVCVFGAAFASRYGNEAKAIMARWAPPASTAHQEASEPPGPAKTLMAQAADAQPSPAPAPSQKETAPSQKETKDVPSTGASPSAAPTTTNQTSAELAQSLQTITHNLASISEKLDQLKSNYDKTLRDQADSLQQLKTAQEQDARDKERSAAQIQALQAQLAASSAKTAAPSPKKESDVAARQRQSVATPPRPKRPSGPWRSRPYMDDPWDDPYW
jgi:hypothetical protein